MKEILKQKKGITLIALVITIIVLLILAGVSIAMLTGENGILTQASNAKLQTEYSDVTEAISLAVSEYTLEKQTNTATAQKSFIDWLKDKGYINNSNEIQVNTLLGKELSTGKGSGTTDVYKLEEVTETAKLASNIKVAATVTTEEDKEYRIVYYDGKGTPNVLRTFSLSTPETLEETDPNLFEITSDGTISLKDYNSYYHNEKDWTIETLVIPSEINGTKVTKIDDYFMGSIDENYWFTSRKNLKKVIIPSSVETIGRYAFPSCSGLEEVIFLGDITTIKDSAFENCTSLTSITIPSSVVNVGGTVFENWTSNQTIYVPFKEGEEPEGWTKYENWAWNSGCNANIVYQQ